METFTREEQLAIWGKQLQGLAQGGLCYGVGDEPDLARYRRMKEIAQLLIEGAGSASDGQVREMAEKLRLSGGMPAEQAERLAREVLGKKETALEDAQLRAWGAELVEMAQVGLEEGSDSPFDIDRYKVVLQLGETLRDLSR